MSKILLSDTFIEDMGELLGEDFKRRGDHQHMIDDTKGLFVEAFLQFTDSEYVDDDACILVEEQKAIDFFKGVKA